MKTIDKFILRAYVGPMILTFFIVMFVLMMNFLWRYIDEFVGKGLRAEVIAELLMHVSITMMPMAIPLATLLAAIMTMGNMGENYELLAMKSCGMSLPRIMKPLTILVGVVAFASFFIANNMVPYAQQQMSAIIYDIRQQKQEIEFKDGLFFNGLDNMSIRVGHQDPDTKLLNEVLIYDNQSPINNMSTILADSGYIRLSEDRRYLLITLHQGQQAQHTRNANWLRESTLEMRNFKMHEQVVSMSGFAFDRTDANAFTNNATAKNINELSRGIDSMDRIIVRTDAEAYAPFMGALFVNDQSLVYDSLRGTKPERMEPVRYERVIDSLTIRQRQKLWSDAVNLARSTRNSFTFEENMSKDTLNQLYRYKTEWHRKLSLPISIMIFFLIGAPLGAIIRRGGLGMPIVISVLFFVIYYIISMTGEKLARDGAWSSFSGMWLSTFILLPIAVFLVYKATNDSNLFNAEWYLAQWKRLRGFLGLRR